MTQSSGQNRKIFNAGASLRGADGFLTVSCAANPLDFRPALDVLEAEIKRRSGKRPLVVLMGELHDRPMHKALRQGLLARLLNGASAGAVACGLELEHNLVEKALSDNFIGKIPADLRERASGPDPDGRKLIQIFHELCLPQEAPASYKNLLAFCYHHNVSVRANDVAKTFSDSQCHIDMRDPMTRNVLRRNAESKFHAWLTRISGISVVSPNGIARRNTVIAEQALKDLRQKGVPVYIQDCGLSHLLGKVQDDKHYKDSLSAYFARANVDVMPVLVTAQGWGVQNVPQESHRMLAENGLIIKGLSEQYFFSLHNREDEVQFLHEVNKESGGELKVYPPWGNVLKCGQ